MEVQPGPYLRVSITVGAKVADSISRWNAYARIFNANAKPLCAQNLRENRLWNGGPMKATVTDAGIVSALALPYTEREQILWHLNHEGTHFCTLKSCVNQSEED